MKDLAQRAKEFLIEQDREWPTLRENRALLAKAAVRSFEFEGFTVRVQFNPGRLSWAHRRPGEGECFLCDHTRPAEQRFIDCGGGFRLMCNPFPILPEHFTIVHEIHAPQRIQGSLDSMLDLAVAMGEDFTIFYNGPQSGASAPDHLHLQAGPTDFFPASAECPRLARTIIESDGWRIAASDQYLRRFICIESSDRRALLDAFRRLYDAQRALQPAASEPLMNVLCNHQNSSWRMIIFPRCKHRPSVYFEPEDRRLLLSPGAVDVSGVLIVPVEEHFAQITREQIAQVYDEVSLEKEKFERLVTSLIT